MLFITIIILLLDIKFLFLILNFNNIKYLLNDHLNLNVSSIFNCKQIDVLQICFCRFCVLLSTSMCVVGKKGSCYKLLKVGFISDCNRKPVVPPAVFLGFDFSTFQTILTGWSIFWLSYRLRMKPIPARREASPLSIFNPFSFFPFLPIESGSTAR